MFCVFVLVCFDQALKVFIKSNFYLGEQLEVFDWFSFYFVENNGFAFGYEFFGGWGKLLLTTIRIVFVIIIFKWIVDFIKSDQNRFVLLAFLLIWDDRSNARREEFAKLSYMCPSLWPLSSSTTAHNPTRDDGSL